MLAAGADTVVFGGLLQTAAFQFPPAAVTTLVTNCAWAGAVRRAAAVSATIQSGMPMPFTTFLLRLAAPTIASLFVTYFILKVYYRKELQGNYRLSTIELEEKAD